MKPFILYDENTDITHVTMVISGPFDIDDDEETIRFFDENINGSARMMAIETVYGVHDISYDDGDFYGYSSYEVKEWGKLKREWRKWFKEMGFETGKWRKYKEYEMCYDVCPVWRKPQRHRLPDNRKNSKKSER